MSWEMKRIGDVCDVIPGFAFKSKDLEETGIPVIKIGNITDDYRVDINSIQCLPENLITEKHEKFLLTNHDILIAMTGATAGKVGRIRCSEEQLLLLNQRVAKFKPRDINPDFFWSAISTPRYRTIFYRLGGGAAQPNMSGAQIEAVEIPYPPPNVQDHIASVLSAYDDLIENNQRRIQLLEQSAQLLYKEWFVHLRFPDHEHLTITDGVPAGWVKKPLGEIADITMGQSPKSIYYNEDGNGLPFHQGVTNFGIRFPSHQKYCTVQNRLAEPGDILFSVRAPVGRINIAPDKIIIGRGLAAIRSRTDQQNFLFYALKNWFFKEDIMGSGAIFAAITKKDLHGVELLQTSDQIAEMFMAHVVPIDLQIEKLHQSNEQLTQARDVLLPRLMNEEVAIEKSNTRGPHEDH